MVKTQLEQPRSFVTPPLFTLPKMWYFTRSIKFIIEDTLVAERKLTGVNQQLPLTRFEEVL